MRFSQKAWVWRSLPPFAAGSPAEASASARSNEDPQDQPVLRGRKRIFLPRS
ncbi:hypothetical protein [Paenibacillus donghaensis]|uniref:hypothetical protein n=1 Tax=Paenibacillus donghaensis TaxID=414771 RepID=UPI0012FD7B24|nr:hypothetical protein [Paenibacillus donghaensis]